MYGLISLKITFLVLAYSLLRVAINLDRKSITISGEKVPTAHCVSGDGLCETTIPLYPAEVSLHSKRAFLWVIHRFAIVSSSLSHI